MLVTLMRHYKVAYEWKTAYSPDGYRIALKEYDQAHVINQNLPIAWIYQSVVISSLPRTLETLAYLKRDAEYQSTSLLDEVPIEPHTDRLKNYSMNLLLTWARLQWAFNNGRQPETRKQTTERTKRFVEGFIKADQNYLIISHGTFLSVLSRILRKQGYEGKAILHIQNGEHFSYRKV
jgi:broad specificity phosphatase PhoE